MSLSWGDIYFLKGFLCLFNSILIGDRLSDISSGEKAGINNIYHVLTGHGVSERRKVIKNYSEGNKKYNLSLINDLNYFKKQTFSS